MKKIINCVKGLFCKANVLALKLMVALSLSTTTAFAASNDQTFKTLTDLFLSYLQGSFGLAISLASVVIGAVAALMTQSLMFLAFGIGLAIGFIYVPDILDSFFSAVLM